ncbi:MAG: ATP-binding protein [Phaeospirillum sp.]|nr:ATP-binding protein [Phaeospirillum sp.]
MPKPLRVLLVEDSPDDAELVELELISGGFAPDIVRVETVAEMRRCLDRGGWDVVLSDYHLPAFGAEEALDMVLASGQDLPFIILSGMVRAEEAVKLMKRGAADFLDKAALARLVPAIEREIRDAVDRAQRREAQEQVRIMSMAVEQSPVAVMITDTKGIITYVNPCFCANTGYERHEVLGRTPNIVKGGDTPVEEYRQLWQTISSGNVWRGMFHNQRKDGSFYWDEASVSPVRDLSGKVSHFVGITLDMTERQLRDQELHKAVRHLTEANTELERFAYVASHDLQEPLRTLTSFTQLLDRRFHGDMDSEAKEYMAFIVDAAKRMHELINDLLAYSRVTGEGRGFARVALADVCAQALRNLKCSIDEAGALIMLGDLPDVVGDEVQLMQLFQNLIGNAIKFRRAGATPEIVVSAQHKAGEWLVSVRDNGIGILTTEQDIFEIFRRLHTHAEYPGTGVGLAVCKCIVQHHLGRIWVESKPGDGSTFFFTLPDTP